MKKVRSTGVTVFGWVFIIGSILSFLQIINPRSISEIITKSGIPAYLAYFGSFIMAALNMLCGVYLLRLRPWARVLAIALCLFSIFSFPVVFKSGVNLSNIEDEAFKRQEQIIYEKYKPDYQKEAMENLERSKEITKKSLPVVFALIMGMGLVWNLGIIYFFTRSKVKEQFESSDEEGDLKTED